MAGESVDLTSVRELMRRAHGVQRDPDGQLHVRHCERVAEAVADEREQATALLHDVLEDTDETPQSLREAGVPSVIVDAVEVLTRRSSERYMSYIARVSKAPGQAGELARTIKVADLRDNLRRSLAMGMAERVAKYEHALTYLTNAGLSSPSS